MPRNDFNEVWGSNAPQFEDPRDENPLLIPTGWQGGAAQEPPKARWENWWHNRVDSGLQDIERKGAMAWIDSAPYGIGAFAIGANGTRYRSISEDNQGNDPVIDTGDNWVIDLDVQYATSQEEADYQRQDVASTPRGIAQGALLNSNLSGSKGHYTIPGGLLVNWIRLPQIDAGQSIFFDFDKSYSQFVFHVSVTVMRTSNASNELNSATFDRTATTNARTLIRNNSSGGRNIEVMVFGI